MEKGSYSLVLRLDGPEDIDVGSLGEIRFPAGHYTYNGSAFGTGGLKRVERHRRTADGHNGKLHWHIDHLLQHATITHVYTREGERLECSVSRALGPPWVDDFGCSDCDCVSHLNHRQDSDQLHRELARFYPE